MLLPGVAFGRWTLAQPLASGAAGVVWRAIEARTGRAVALKLLPLDAGGAERAARESEVMARVRHPGVVRVHGTVEAHGHAAIVMDLARGSLAGLVERVGPMPADVALEAAALVADALAAAHAAGVVHRDVKPHNLLWFDDAPRVRLSDFGIAQAPAHARTRTGALLGSIPFMAPEQRRDARAVQPATDVYALGVTLAWLLVGEAPHDPFGPDAAADLVAAGVPPGLAPLIIELGAWRPQDRPRDGEAARARLQETRVSAGLVDGALARWLDGCDAAPDTVAAEERRPAPVTAAPPVPVPPLRAAGMGLLLGGALVGAGAWVSALPARPAPAAAPVRSAEIPPCADAVRAWVDDLRMGPRESIEAGVADLDADGHPDVLIDNNYSESVSVWWGRAGGMPTEQTEVPSGRSDSHPAAADIDGDGVLDLVVANNDGRGFRLLHGLGGRRFAPLEDVFQSPGPRHPVWVDGDLYFSMADGTDVLGVRDRVGSGWADARQIAPGVIPIGVVHPAEGTPWMLLRSLSGGWARLDPRDRPPVITPLDLPVDTESVLIARPPGASGDALHVVTPHTIVRQDADGGRCILAAQLPNSAPLALADLDGDGTLDAVRIDTCARCESNHVFVRGLR